MLCISVLVSCNTFCQEKLCFVKIVHSDIKGVYKGACGCFMGSNEYQCMQNLTIFQWWFIFAADFFKKSLKNLQTGAKCG